MQLIHPFIHASHVCATILTNVPAGQVCTQDLVEFKA
jgi:hypothetical protein